MLLKKLRLREKEIIWRYPAGTSVDMGFESRSE